MEKVASLEEIERSWTLERVADANDMLNYMAAQQRESEANKPRPERKVGRLIRRFR